MLKKIVLPLLIAPAVAFAQTGTLPPADQAPHTYVPSVQQPVGFVPPTEPPATRTPQGITPYSEQAIPSTVESYNPPPAPQQAGVPAQVLPPEHAYQYTPYKIDQVFRKLPFAVIVQAVSSEVRKDERGLLWTYTNFKVLQPVKGNFQNNAFALRVVGGSQTEDPLLQEHLYTGGLDLMFSPGDTYFMFIDGVNEAGYPIVERQHVYVITALDGQPVIRDFKGGQMKIKRESGALYKQYEPVYVNDFLKALSKVH